MQVSMTPTERLIVALDFQSRDEILRTADQLRGVAGVLKIGLQALTANGPDLVNELAGRGEKVFLDVKFHDIPNTVQQAVAAASQLGAYMLTIHASGGPAMMSAAAKAKNRVRLLGVTILTSLDDDELRKIGFEGNAQRNVARLARLARQSGLDGVVASPLEIATVRQEAGDGFLIVTPGIRAPGESTEDQRRTLSAAEAVRAGADYIVVGRPITRAPDPRAAATRLVEGLAAIP